MMNNIQLEHLMELVDFEKNNEIIELKAIRNRIEKNHVTSISIPEIPGFPLELLKLIESYLIPKVIFRRNPIPERDNISIYYLVVPRALFRRVKNSLCSHAPLQGWENRHLFKYLACFQRNSNRYLNIGRVGHSSWYPAPDTGEIPPNRLSIAYEEINLEDFRLVNGPIYNAIIDQIWNLVK